MSNTDECLQSRDHVPCLSSYSGVSEDAQLERYPVVALSECILE